MNDAIVRAAQYIADHRTARRRMPGLPADVRPHDETNAYSIQDALHDVMTRAGQGTVVGHKIGCTTPVMQKFLGISNPCAGGVFDRTVHRRSAELRFDDFVRIGVECEIIVLIDRDLPAAGAPYDIAGAAAAVGALAAGIELVEDRYIDYKALDAPTLIADDFFNTGAIIGDPVSNWRALDAMSLVGTMQINGGEAGRGRASDVMGHPFAALAWLANTLAARGRALVKGDFVCTGSIVETKWVARGDHCVATIDQLGSVGARFV